MPATIIFNYFKELTENQRSRLEQLIPLYKFWNGKINIISRKDMDNLAERHILHSLSIAKIIQFKKNDTVIDVGTGGGFPGIPLSILFPETHFTLVDSIGKKIKVVNEIIHELKLDNVTGRQERAEKIKEKYQYIVSRAVSSLPEFVAGTKHLVEKNNKDKHELIYLKGGDFMSELSLLKYKVQLYNISDFFTEPFFETKKIIRIYFR